MNDEISFTYWPGIRGVGQPKSMKGPWPRVVQLLSTRQVLESKLSGPGFGGYTLTHPKRRDEFVEAMTLAVFDADLGDVQSCRDALQNAGLAHLAYTTYSHTPTHPSWRLVLRPDRPIPPQEWPLVRFNLIRKFRIPADLIKCSGLSHFYFLPSNPPESTPLARTVYTEGSGFIVTEFLDPIPGARRPKPVSVAEFAPPPEPNTPVDLESLRETLRRGANRLERKNEHDKAHWLRNLVDSKPLCGHGSRNEAVWRTCGVMVYTSPGQSLGTYMSLIMPSIEQMIAAGSSVTEELVERAVLGAMANKSAEDKHLEDLKANFERAQAAIPVVKRAKW